MIHCRHVLMMSVMLACPGFAVLSGSDAEAESFLKEAAEQRKAEKFASAADSYKGAAHMADTPAMKANALIEASLCYRAAKQYGKEFDCLETLLRDYITHVDFKRAVTREYEIAEDFFNGHRDWIVSWLPFIKGEDRTVEIYEAALKNAACAEQAPEARLRLGAIYLDNQKPDEALKYFREVLSLHPESSAARYAMLELCRTYLLLAERGDGDGAWTRLAAESLENFIRSYPEDAEIPWAKRSLDKIHTIDSERLYGIGKFYHRTGRDDLAERYLSRVIRDYGAGEDSKKSERLLAEIDKTYEPPAEDAPREKKYVHVYERHTIPLESNPTMIVPENSQGKWLLPIQDLKADKLHDSRNDVPERKVNVNEF